jgi:hypothetical protein
MGPDQSYKRHRYLNEIAFAYRDAGKTGHHVWWFSGIERDHPTWTSASLMSNSDYYMPWFIQHQCNKWKWRITEILSYPGNVITVESTLEDYQAANLAVLQPDLDVYRDHLDQIIIKTRRSLEQHIDQTYREWESRQPLLLNDTPRQIIQARDALIAFDVMFK